MSFRGTSNLVTIANIQDFANPTVFGDGSLEASVISESGVINVAGAEKATVRDFKIATVGTDFALVAATVGSAVRLLRAHLSNQGSVLASVVFNTKPAGAGTAISIPFFLAANGGGYEIVRDDDGGIKDTSTNDGLSVTVAGASVGIDFKYVLV